MVSIKKGKYTEENISLHSVFLFVSIFHLFHRNNVTLNEILFCCIQIS